MLKEVRCACGRLLAKVGAGTEIQIKCSRCGVLNHLKAMSLPTERHRVPGLKERSHEPAEEATRP